MRSIRLLACALALSFAASCDNDGPASPDFVSPSTPAGLTAAAAGGGIGVSWQAVAETDVDAYLVVSFPGSPDSVPVAGATYAVGQAFGSGRVVHYGGATSFIDLVTDGCSPRTYAAWAHDVAGNWSVSPATRLVPAGTVGGAPPTAPPTGLTALPSGANVLVSWTNPAAGTGSTRVRVLRKQGSAPTSSTDGTVVHDAAGTSATHAMFALEPNTTYHYRAFACNGCNQCEAVGAAATLTPTLSQALQGGGYNLHFRHASADVCADRTDLGTAATTSVPGWWLTCDTNCATTTARQLNATGHAEAASIGSAIRSRGIPVGRVISSEFCRNTQTATGMAFPVTTEISQAITFFVYDEANRCNASNTLLAQSPASGSNTIIIGHAGFSCGVLGSLAWSEAAIFRPDGAGGSTLVGRVLWNGWAGLP